MAIVFVAVVGLYLFFTRAKLGLAIQAVVDDPALLGLAGTSPAAVRRFSWLVGSCFAALSGMLLAPSLALDARLLTLLVFFAFGAAAVGRLLQPAAHLRRRARARRRAPRSSPRSSVRRT